MNFNLWSDGTAAIKNAGLVCAVLFALVGCGGGSSSSSTDNQLPSPVPGGIDDNGVTPGPDGQAPATPDELDLLPKISVGGRQFADPNVLLTLQGSVEAAEGATIVRTLWIQVGGPTVRIPSPLQLNNLILVPDVNLATQLEFRLVAEDSEGRINSATVSVLVKPVPTFVKVVGGVFEENDELAVFTVRLSAPNALPVIVTYMTQDGTAIGGLDYVYTSGEMVFEPGEVEKEIAVVLINDTEPEPDESFSLRVTAINGEATHANVGVAIIRNGAEPQQEQSLQFSNAGPVNIYVGDEYINPLNAATAPGTGTIVFSSSDTSVAMVDSAGYVIGTGLGTADITATKLADDTYFSATASYTVQVISRGAVPSVGIETEGYPSITLDETIYLFGYADDEEDGNLPTQAEREAFEQNGTPITSVYWESDLDGFLGYGENLQAGTLTMGNHIITYSAVDSDGNVGSSSIQLTVGNIAPLAFASAESTYCLSPTDGMNCYFPYRVNDKDFSTELGGWTSWVNDPPQDLLPQEIVLDWSYPAYIRGVDLYTSEGYELQNYLIQVRDPQTEEWITLETVVGNRVAYRSHVVEALGVYSLRILAQRGPDIQPSHGRVNEIVVFGETESFFPAAMSSIMP